MSPAGLETDMDERSMDEARDVATGRYRDAVASLEPIQASYVEAEARYARSVEERERAWNALHGDKEDPLLRAAWVKAQGRARRARVKLVESLIALKVAGVSIPPVVPRVAPRVVPKVVRSKAPSVKTMERWMNDGVARAVDGCKVEPDGSCPHGSRSWLLELGLI